MGRHVKRTGQLVGLKAKNKPTREQAFAGAVKKAKKNLAPLLKRYPPEELFEKTFRRKAVGPVKARYLAEPFPHIEFLVEGKNHPVLAISPAIGGVFPSKSEVKLQHLKSKVTLVQSPHSSKHEAEHVFQVHSRRCHPYDKIIEILSKLKRNKTSFSAVENIVKKRLNDEIGARLASGGWGLDRATPGYGEAFVRIHLPSLFYASAPNDEVKRQMRESEKKLGKQVEEVAACVKEALRQGVSFKELREIQRNSTFDELPQKIRERNKRA